MKKSALRLVAVVCLVPLFGSCNLYEPLGNIGDDETYRQAAQACLHKGDYNCAIEYLNRLSDSPEKSQDLCSVTLAQSGMTLVALVNTVSKGSTGVKLLGTLAETLGPWTADKETYATNAKARCSSLPAASTQAGQNLNTLLTALGYMVDCAMRMAKTDITVANTNGGACTEAAGNQNGLIEADDIATDATLGTIGAGETGMCDADALLCKADIDALNLLGPALTSAGLGEIAGNIDDLPDGATSDLLRAALRTATLQ